jgi:ligand-binding sensor domain-containing protein
MKRTSLVSLYAALASGLALVVLAGTWIVWRGSQAIHQADQDVRAGREFRFIERPFIPPANPGFEEVSSSEVFLQAARFQDHLYVAGPTGLLEYTLEGSLVHRYSVGIDLPGSPLVALAPAVLSDSRQEELIIATAGSGILAFNGRGFRQILPTSSDALAVTAILPTASGHLLFGTKKRGVLVYDGKQITVLHSALDSLYVTALFGSDSDLWIGTLDRGVLHFHGGEVESFAEAEGLPDRQVQSIAVSGGTIFAGTPTGVAVFESGWFSRVLTPGIMATALFATPSTLYVGSEDQGVVEIVLRERRPNPNVGQGRELAEVRQIFSSGDSVYAVARDGLYRKNVSAFGWERVLRPSTANLSDRNVSALAADSNGQLWVGYFDRGLDVLSADGRVRHIEDEHVFCVNRIFQEKPGAMDVATANGLVRFDAAGNELQVLTRADGLIADHVTDIANYRDGLALATPAGLTFLEPGGARSMYAFHGLVNNHVYALGVAGDELMAGTLGGLSQLSAGDVKFNYTTATSNLKHNWITAIVPVESEWMVGTYGAGVLALDSSGKFHGFETASAPVVINPNAMYVSPSHVLAGTLGDGIYSYDRQSGRWSAIRAGLPSLNVTAFAVANGYVYVGTDNGLVRIPEQKLHR